MKENFTKNEFGMRKKVRRIDVICVFIFILSISICIFCLLHPMFRLKEVDLKVSSNDFIKEDELQKILDFKINRNIFLQRIFKAKFKLENDPKIKNVKIVYKLPNKILVNIEARTPKYKIAKTDGYYILDKNGYVLYKTYDNLDLIQIIGIDIKDLEFGRISEDEIKKLQNINIIVNTLKEVEFPQKLEILSIIENEYILEFPKIKKIVKLNELSNLLSNMQCIKEVMKKEEGKAGLIYIDKNYKRKYFVFREEIEKEKEKDQAKDKVQEKKEPKVKNN